MADIIQLRRDTAANWTSANPVLAQGEVGVDLDADQVKIGDGATAWNDLSYALQGPSGPPSVNGRLLKSNPQSVAWERTGNGSARSRQALNLYAGGIAMSIPAEIVITMPTLVAGNDYTIWWHNPTAALIASANWDTPPESNAIRVGGFHYSPGGLASFAARAGGNTTPQINPYSFWDLSWRPICDPRGMTFIGPNDGLSSFQTGTHKPFWCDIYLCGINHHVDGTSRNNVIIADSGNLPKIPTYYNGNGTATFAATQLNFTRLMAAYGKRPPSYDEFQALAFGVQENLSRGNDPVTTGLGTTNTGSNVDEKFTSAYGVIQASGAMWIWGRDHGSNVGGSGSNNTESQGLTWGLPYVSFFGSSWGNGGAGGSRSFRYLLASDSAASIGARGVADHLNLVF